MHVSTSDVIGFAIFALCFAAIVYRLTAEIRRNVHPSRSVWTALSVTLAAIIFLPIGVGAVSVFTLSGLSQFGIDLGKTGVALVIGAFLGACVGAWGLSKRWMQKPKFARQ